MLTGGSSGRLEVGKDEGPGRLVPSAVTDTGCERELNEDRYAVIEGPSGVTWLVCDGMGGMPGGELAAQLAIEAIRRDLETLPERDPEVALRGAIQEANRVIVLRRQNQAFSGMGTTVVGAVFKGAEVVVGHAGDSRAYLVRDGAIQQLTTDHTYVQQLVDQGQIRPEEALVHHQSHILTKCIGSEPGLEIEASRFWMWDVPPGEKSDLLVLCSDGLYSLVGDGEIANAVSSLSPQRACAELVELARSRGGFDNITLTVIPITGQLRAEPPIGYVSSARSANNSGSGGRGGGLIGSPKVKMFIMVAALAAVFAVLTVLMMFLFMGG